MSAVYKLNVARLLQ